MTLFFIHFKTIFTLFIRPSTYHGKQKIYPTTIHGTGHSQPLQAFHKFWALAEFRLKDQSIKKKKSVLHIWLPKVLKPRKFYVGRPYRQGRSSQILLLIWEQFLNSQHTMKSQRRIWKYHNNTQYKLHLNLTTGSILGIQHSDSPRQASPHHLLTFKLFTLSWNLKFHCIFFNICSFSYVIYHFKCHFWTFNSLQPLQDQLVPHLFLKISFADFHHKHSFHDPQSISQTFSAGFVNRRIHQCPSTAVTQCNILHSFTGMSRPLRPKFSLYTTQVTYILYIVLMTCIAIFCTM